MNGYALQNKIRTLAPEIRDIKAWHEEQLAELNWRLGQESEVKFHKKAIEVLSKLLP